MSIGAVAGCAAGQVMKGYGFGPVGNIAAGIIGAIIAGWLLPLVGPATSSRPCRRPSAIGDDRLQRRGQGYVVPDAFTHGSSEQRTRWFMTGLKSGQVDSCDTFRTQQL
jgi:Putative neutral zinc metallopeptidase